MIYVLFTVIDDPTLCASESVDIIGYTDDVGYSQAVEMAAEVAKADGVKVVVVPACRFGGPAVSRDEAALMVDLVDEVMALIHHDPNASAFVDGCYDLPKAAVVAALAVTWTYAGDYRSPKPSALRKVAWAIQEGMDTTDSPGRNWALAVAELIRRLMVIDYDINPELFESLLDEIGQIAQSFI